MGITFKLSSEIWNVKRGRKANITLQCVVPENIQTPTMEGISLKTHPLPPTSLDFPFLQGTYATPPPSPPPSEFPQVRQRPLNPSGKVHFLEERLLM